MKRTLRLCCGLAFLALTGCSDNLHAVLRDYYNVENEGVDHLVYVCDEGSAKAYNDLVKNRLRPKEEQIRERLEKLEKQQVTQIDQKLFAEEHLKVQSDLKGEIGGLDGRFRKEQARIRRIIVKLSEDKMEEMKSSDTSFTVEAAQIWPQLSNTEQPKKFSGNDGMAAKMDMAGGGPGGKMMGNAMMGGAGGGMMGGPGGGMMGGPGGGMMGMPGGGMMGGAGGVASSNPTFSIQCERIVNAAGQKDWRVTRRWHSGSKVVELEINGVNLTPLFSDAGGG
jgi:hypothetical protein